MSMPTAAITMAAGLSIVSVELSAGRTSAADRAFARSHFGLRHQEWKRSSRARAV